MESNKTTTVILSCGSGEDNCPNGLPNGDEVILEGMRDAAREQGFNVIYTDTDSNLTKDAQADVIVDFMNIGGDSDIYLAGHSMGADATILALYKFYMNGGDTSRVKGVAILDSTLDSGDRSDDQWEEIASVVADVYGGVTYGYESNQEVRTSDPHVSGYEAYYKHLPLDPDHLRLYTNHPDEPRKVDHYDLENPGFVTRQITIDFGW